MFPVHRAAVSCLLRSGADTWKACFPHPCAAHWGRESNWSGGMERRSLPWPGLSLLTAQLGLENEAGCISGIIPGASLCTPSLVDAKCGDVISASMPGPEMRFLPLGTEQLLFPFPIYMALYFRLSRWSEEPKGVSISSFPYVFCSAYRL